MQLRSILVKICRLRRHQDLACLIALCEIMPPHLFYAVNSTLAASEHAIFVAKS